MANEEYLIFDQAELISDDDPSSWEELVLSVELPTNADFGALTLVAKENVSNDQADEFDGHSADEASLVFRQTVPTVPATWSRVKAAY